MAEERQKQEWHRAAALSSWVHQSLTGQWIDPARRNPYAPPPPPKTAEVKKAEGKQAVAIVKAYMSRGRRKRKKEGS